MISLSCFFTAGKIPIKNILHITVKKLFLLTDFQNSATHFTTNLPPSIKIIHYPQNPIPRSQNHDNNCFTLVREKKNVLLVFVEDGKSQPSGPPFNLETVKAAFPA